MQDYTLTFVVTANSIDEAVDILDNTPFEEKLEYIVNLDKSKEEE